MKPSPTELALAPESSALSAPVQRTEIPHPLVLLERAMQAGLTAENVAVAEKLLQMAREQRAEEAKAAFAKSFFMLRKNMPAIYADKEAKDKSGNVTFTYCSEEELSKALEPHLMTYGFAMLFGQSSADGRITVNVTLMHQEGHSEVREFTVRSGTPNAMKDAAMCDAGGATMAWRHLMIKMFGLKSRLQTGNDARIDGEKITKDKALYLRELVRETKTDEKRFLDYAGAPTFEDIGETRYDDCARMLHKKQLLAK